MRSIQSLRISRDLLSEKTVEMLRWQIVSGQLRAGSRLVEEDLALRLGTSRAPLREALSVLAREGLVENERGKGTFVKGLTEESLRQQFTIRSLLEVFAARSAAARIDDAAAVRLLELAELMHRAARDHDEAEFIRSDLAIHRAIWQLADNPFLLSALEPLVAPLGALMRLNAEATQDAAWTEAARSHRELAEAIVSRNTRLAGSLMQASVEVALEEALAALASQRANGRADSAGTSERVEPTSSV
jgi:DNA-binding GntR family transcriptional regulator